LVANFEESDDPIVEHTITLKSNPEGAGTLTGSEKYIKNTTAILAATPSQNYKFVN
jgi:hypothetical protein